MDIKEKGNLIVWGIDGIGEWNALHTNVAEEEVAEILSKYPSYDGFKWASCSFYSGLFKTARMDC